MRKVLKYILGVVFITILLLSILYINTNHDYELTKVEDITTDDNYINITYEEPQIVEDIVDGSILGILTIEKIGLKAQVKEGSTQEILKEVYEALSEKGYNPINQIVGYILSGDPTYITSHKNARNIIRSIERDELLEKMVKEYIGINK